MRFVPRRAFGTAAAALALAIPALSGTTVAHAQNGLVDTAVFSAGVCVFAGAFPDATGPCVANVGFPVSSANASVGSFSGGGSILEPAGDLVTLSFTGNQASVTPNCMGCPGAGIAVVVGSATDEGVTCPLVGTLVLAGGAATFVVSGNLTWEGC